MFGWSVVVLVGTSTCRSRRSARGLDSPRESEPKRGLAGRSRTPVKTCGNCSGRPAGAARREGCSREGSSRSRVTEGASVSEQTPALTCPRRTAIRRSEVGPHRGPSPGRPKKRCQRFAIDRAPGEPKTLRSPTRKARRRRRGVDRTEAGPRAVKRAAAGGRMTERWSGVVPGRKVATPSSIPGAVCQIDIWGCGSPHGVLHPETEHRRATGGGRQAVSGGGAHHRVLVT